MGVQGHDCPFEFALFVLLHILCYKSFPKWHLARVTLWHLSNWFNVTIISGNESSLFTWCELVTMLNLLSGKIQRVTLKISHFCGRDRGRSGLELSFLLLRPWSEPERGGRGSPPEGQN